jgi:rhodanese-related sulfurtransferase
MRTMTNLLRHTPTAAGRGVAALLLLVATAVGAAACGSDSGTGSASSGSTSSTGAAAPLGVDAFAAAAAQPGTILIDVRTPAEFASGHLAGAVNVDVQGSGFADAVAGLDPAGHYAVYCHSGNRSAVAVSYLRDHGFGSVAELGGGIAAWQAAGKPVTTD